MKKFTFTEFNKLYPDEKACLEKVFQLRYGQLKECPKCSTETKFKRVSTRNCYQCPECLFQIYPAAGTVFHKSSTPLNSWFYAIYLQTTTRNGVSAKELERQLDICYTTALRMSHQIKKLFAYNFNNLNGVVEMDETVIGGRISNMHKWKRDWLHENRADNKTYLFTAIERGTGRIFHKILGGKPTKILVRPVIREGIQPGSVVMTDDSTVYYHMSKYYIHHAVNHKAGEYVRGDYTTNTVEGYFSLLKRTIKGTHIHVSPKYLHLYAEEVAFRYYHRNNQENMFEEALKKLIA